MTPDTVTSGPVAQRLLPLFATAALHGVLVLALLLRWDWQPPRTVEVRKLTPQIIEAELVSMDRYRAPEAERREARRQPAPTEREAPQRAAPRERRPPQAAARAAKTGETTREAAAAAERARPEPATEPEPGGTEQSERERAEALAALARRELAAAVASEEAARVAVSAEEMAASYAALIQRTVVGYWSRPPSARNGMEALLAVQLVPTGEVVSVNVLESSGNAAFDRSAINAVERAGRFPELSNLPRREFEKTFRRFRLLFRPEDLRY